MGSANVTFYAQWTPLPWTWTDQSAAGSRFWESITSSSDGTHLAAVVSGGGIYASSDSGSTWLDITPSGVESTPMWTSIASSSDGTHLAATGYSGDIWTGVYN